jgi:hypothetical protein
MGVEVMVWLVVGWVVMPVLVLALRVVGGGLVWVKFTLRLATRLGALGEVEV